MFNIFNIRLFSNILYFKKFLRNKTTEFNIQLEESQISISKVVVSVELGF